MNFVWKPMKTPRSTSRKSSTSMTNSLRKEFQVSQKVLLFNSRLKLIVGKLIVDPWSHDLLREQGALLGKSRARCGSDLLNEGVKEITRRSASKARMLRSLEDSSPSPTLYSDRDIEVEH
ncbi:hypothetical protein CR513_20588, partial [Mucuna pruriens]